jgi:hypothetical protein
MNTRSISHPSNLRMMALRREDILCAVDMEEYKRCPNQCKSNSEKYCNSRNFVSFSATCNCASDSALLRSGFERRGRYVDGSSGMILILESSGYFICKSLFEVNG